MTKFTRYLLFVFLSLSISSCVKVEEYGNTPQGNFEALWKIMDEKYCFFDYKHVNWDSVHTVYADRIKENMTDKQLFSVLDSMLAVLKDGHVNLLSSFDIGRYWDWYTDYPHNFNIDIVNAHYLMNDYQISAGIDYKILNDNIGYIYYPDFSVALGEGNLDNVINALSLCDGIIIDVRDNGGGLMSNADMFARRFVNQKTLIGYILHKTGPGHNDFSAPYPRYLEPTGRLRYQKGVVLLTNRRCFSATNDFVNSMSYCPNVTIMGDKTGGGSGLPFSSELPNGWAVRFSACPILNAAKQQIEFGIEPDIKVEMNSSDESKGIDTLIEEARASLKKNK